MDAMRHMNGKYIGNRPIKLRKSTWQDRMQTSDKNKAKKGWLNQAFSPAAACWVLGGDATCVYISSRLFGPFRHL